MKKEFLISFLIFIPLAAFLSYINYDDTSSEINLTQAIAGGFIGALGIFFVPYIIKKLKSKNE